MTSEAHPVVHRLPVTWYLHFATFFSLVSHLGAGASLDESVEGDFLRWEDIVDWMPAEKSHRTAVGLSAGERPPWAAGTAVIVPLMSPETLDVMTSFYDGRNYRPEHRHLRRRTRVVKRRPVEMDISQSVCPSYAAWRVLRTALDINNTLVRVYQPDDVTNDVLDLELRSSGKGQGQAPPRQWFYTVTCQNDALLTRRDCVGCCLAVDHARYISSCEQKRSYVMAYVSHSTKPEYMWTWIQVDTSCSCAVVPRVIPEF